MPGPRFRPDDIQAFNDFGKPIIQVTPDTATDPKCSCCAKCDQYLQCFKKVPIAIDWKGLDFSAYMEWAQWIWDNDPVVARTGDFSGDDPDGSSEFVGQFLFLPRDGRESCVGQGCFGIPVSEEEDALVRCRPYCGTHHSPYYRTVKTTSEERPNKMVSLFAYVTCCHEDEEDPNSESIGVKFGIALQIEFEGGDWGWVNSGHWYWGHDPGSSTIYNECCNIMETECILWDDLDPNDWSNLQDLQLHRIGKWWYGGDIEDDGTSIGCQFNTWGWFGSESICTGWADEPGIDCISCTDGSEINECPNGTIDVGSITEPSCDGVPIIVPACIPDPIKLLDPNPANNTLSVLGHCRPKECTQCPPPSPAPEPMPPAVTVQIGFSTSNPTACGKTFTALYPACLNPVKFYWSFGEEGEEVFHVINNLLGDTDVNFGEIVTLTIIDDRGCIYTHCEIVDCSCCAGLSGSLDISVANDGSCSVTMTAHISGNEECGQAHIEILRGNEVCPPLPVGSGDCTCQQMFDNDNECDAIANGCALSLGDGQTHSFTVDQSQTIKWRLIDGPCGCASEWNEFPIYCGVCDCCLGTITSCEVTIENWNAGEEPACCDEVNKTYVLEPLLAGFNCQWRYGYFGGVGEGDSFTCPAPEIDPDPEYGIQMDYVISCNEIGGDPINADLKGTLTVTAGAGATFIAIALDTVIWDPDEGVYIPADCTILTGFHENIDPVESVCNPLSAIAYVELKVG